MRPGPAQHPRHRRRRRAGGPPQLCTPHAPPPGVAARRRQQRQQRKMKQGSAEQRVWRRTPGARTAGTAPGRRFGTCTARTRRPGCHARLATARARQRQSGGGPAGQSDCTGIAASRLQRRRRRMRLARCAASAPSRATRAAAWQRQLRMPRWTLAGPTRAGPPRPAPTPPCAGRQTARRSRRVRQPRPSRTRRQLVRCLPARQKGRRHTRCARLLLPDGSMLPAAGLPQLRRAVCAASR